MLFILIIHRLLPIFVQFKLKTKMMTTKDQLQISIKKTLKEKGLTIAELAERMGISQPSLSQSINGNPTVEMLERIATALDVDIRVFFEGSGNDINGLVQYKNHTYKIDSVESIKKLLSDIENNA